MVELRRFSNGRSGVPRGPAKRETPAIPVCPRGLRGFHLAETGGFEPPVEFNPDPSLAVKSVRPLRHVSAVYPMPRRGHIGNSAPRRVCRERTPEVRAPYRSIAPPVQPVQPVRPVRPVP